MEKCINVDETWEPGAIPKVSKLKMGEGRLIVQTMFKIITVNWNIFLEISKEKNGETVSREMIGIFFFFLSGIMFWEVQSYENLK